jgi:hypothetical protein
MQLMTAPVTRSSTMITPASSPCHRDTWRDENSAAGG